MTKQKRGSRAVDLVGQKFGRLLVVSRESTNRSGARWLCDCDCGNQTIARTCHLKSGNTSSCGCWGQVASVTHGMYKTITYQSWSSMIVRCTKPNNKSYLRYGGAGIVVCERWLHSFENFLADMGERPPGTSLDRFPNGNGNYEPGNCRWATSSQQNRNKRSSVLSESDAEVAVALYRDGLRPKEIATRFGVTPNLISQTVRRRRLLEGH